MNNDFVGKSIKYQSKHDFRGSVVFLSVFFSHCHITKHTSTNNESNHGNKTKQAIWYCGRKNTGTKLWKTYFSNLPRYCVTVIVYLLSLILIKREKLPIDVTITT